MISALWWCKRPHTSKECRCSWGGKLKLLQHRPEWKSVCTMGRKVLWYWTVLLQKGVVLNCLGAVFLLFHIQSLAGKTQFTSAGEIWFGIFVHSALANLSSLCFSIALFSLPCFFWFLCPQGQVEIPELTLMICECYWKQLSGRSPVLQTGSLILLGEKALFFTSKQVLIT